MFLRSGAQQQSFIYSNMIMRQPRNIDICLNRGKRIVVKMLRGCKMIDNLSRVKRKIVC